MSDDTRANYPHYHKNVRYLTYVDVYRVLSLFEDTDPAIQHAIKKLLVPGRRGQKDRAKDLREAVVSINRALQMMDEDNRRYGDVQVAEADPVGFVVTGSRDMTRYWNVSWAQIRGSDSGKFSKIEALTMDEAFFHAHTQIAEAGIATNNVQMTGEEVTEHGVPLQATQG